MLKFARSQERVLLFVELEHYKELGKSEGISWAALVLSDGESQRIVTLDPEGPHEVAELDFVFWKCQAVVLETGRRGHKEMDSPEYFFFLSKNLNSEYIQKNRQIPSRIIQLIITK